MAEERLHFADSAVEERQIKFEQQQEGLGRFVTTFNLDKGANDGN